MKGFEKSFESRLYDTTNPISYKGLNTTTNIKNNTITNKKAAANKKPTTNKKPNRFKKYAGISSSIGGLLFAGVGYTVAATGSLLKDIGGYICSELPQIPQYVSKGIDYSAFQYFSTFLGESFARANYYGGLGAAVGLLGGSILAIKFKNSITSLGSRILSIFKR